MSPVFSMLRTESNEWYSRGSEPEIQGGNEDTIKRSLIVNGKEDGTIGLMVELSEYILTDATSMGISLLDTLV